MGSTWDGTFAKLNHRELPTAPPATPPAVCITQEGGDVLWIPPGWLHSVDTIQEGLDAPEPGNTNGTAVYQPVLIPKQKPASSAHPIHVFVMGNCPTHSDRLGNNKSKLVLASKAAGIWHGHHSGVHAHVVVINFATA